MSRRISIDDCYAPPEVDLWGHVYAAAEITKDLEKRLVAAQRHLMEATADEEALERLFALIDERLTWSAYESPVAALEAELAEELQDCDNDTDKSAARTTYGKNIATARATARVTGNRRVAASKLLRKMYEANRVGIARIAALMTEIGGAEFPN